MKASVWVVSGVFLIGMGCGSDIEPKEGPISAQNGNPNGQTNVQTNGETGANALPSDTCPEQLIESNGDCIAPDRSIELSVGLEFQTNLTQGYAEACLTEVVDAEVFERFSKENPLLVYSEGDCSVYDTREGDSFETGIDRDAFIEGGFSVTKDGDTREITGTEITACASARSSNDAFFVYDTSYILRSDGSEAPEFEQSISTPSAVNFETPEIVKGQDLVVEYQSRNAEVVELSINSIVSPELDFISVECVQDDSGRITVPSGAIDLLPSERATMRLEVSNQKRDVVDGTLFRTVGYSRTLSTVDVVQ